MKVKGDKGDIPNQAEAAPNTITGSMSAASPAAVNLIDALVCSCAYSYESQCCVWLCLWSYRRKLHY